MKVFLKLIINMPYSGFAALLVAALLGFSGCSTIEVESGADAVAVKALAVTNLSHPEPSVFASGQPSLEQLAELSAAGVKNIINLRTQDELDWDEAEAVAAAGMGYYELPIAGLDALTTENAQKLAALLESLGSAPTLVHCGSSNRVGAPMALHAAQARGLGVDEAIAEGRRWGLTGLEPAIRKKIVTD